MSVQLLCADVCPEVVPLARADRAILDDSRVLSQLLRAEMHSVPSVDYFDCKSELQPYMRRVVTTWMLEVAEEQNCEEQVFPLAVNLLDRFLAASSSSASSSTSATPVGRCQLQLLGCVCLLTASKLRQCRPIGVDLLVYYTDHSVTADEIRVWEMLLLARLEWDVSGVTAFDFVDQLMERLAARGRHSPPNDVRRRTVRGHALTYVSLCCTETDYMTMRPSMVAAASISAALNRLGLSETGVAAAAASADDRLLAAWIGADAAELGRLVAAMEALMTAQLTSVQHQHQQQQQQTVASASVASQSKNKVSTWEDVQPETPTDVQDVHF